MVEQRGENEGLVEASGVPDGARQDTGVSGGSASSSRLSTLSAQPSSSQGVPVGPGLDLLASLGEAEQLILTLKGFADLIPDPRWQIISKGLDVIIKAHDDLNSTPAR